MVSTPAGACWVPGPAAIGNAFRHTSRGVVLGLTSRLLADEALMATPFCPAVRADVLQRSVLCAAMAVLGDLEAENMALGSLMGIAPLTVSALADVQCVVPPGLATRVARVWARLQSALQEPTTTLGTVLGAVLPLVSHMYRWLYAQHPDADAVSRALIAVPVYASSVCMSHAIAEPVCLYALCVVVGISVC